MWLFRVWFFVFRLGGLEFLGFRVFSVLMVLRNLKVKGFRVWVLYG